MQQAAGSAPAVPPPPAAAGPVAEVQPAAVSGADGQRSKGNSEGADEPGGGKQAAAAEEKSEAELKPAAEEKAAAKEKEEAKEKEAEEKEKKDKEKNHAKQVREKEEAEAKATGESLQLIKAKTMYEMVHEVDANRSVLFLTNAQAEVLASSPQILQKMIDVFYDFELPRPKLVINLIESAGFSNQLNDTQKLTTKKEDEKKNRPPFLTMEDERKAEDQLDCFMADVIIPLAARTSAIVLVNAFSQNCILTQSFNRMVAISRAKWAGQLPFSIVAIVVEVCCLMNNTDENAEWRNVRSKCKPWKARTELMKQLVTKEVEENEGKKKRAGCRSPKERTTHDLDPNSSVYIIVDSISKDEKEIGP